MAEDKGSYETFDSGKSKTIPSECADDFDHKDANPSDQGVKQGAVPKTPQE